MKKIELYGKEYPNRVTCGALIDFKHETGKEAAQIGNDVCLLVLFMYCCVRSACRADGVPFDLTFERFSDGIDLDGFVQLQEGMKQREEESKKKPERAEI